MAPRTEAGNARDDGPARVHASTEDDVPQRRDAAPVFNPKGIESNIFLTAVAAVVPLVIVGAAGIKTILGARRGKR